MTRDRFEAFRIHSDSAGHRAGIESLVLDDLNPGTVAIKVAYSSVNYKDALAGTGTGRILRRSPLVGGIDVAGHVVASGDARFKEGDAVLCTGSGLSETRDGGYAGYARLEADWTIPLPPGLSLRESMILGTAGFTAALSLLRMQDNHQRPQLGPIAITGATGGVGMLATAIFSRAGYAAHAITGKPEHADFLRTLGASEVLDRRAFRSGQRPLESVRYGGALDTVGGSTLAGLLPLIAPYGNVAACGLAAGAELATTVMPFIIRGVSLLGIASAATPRDQRERVWAQLAGDWKPAQLDAMATREITLAMLPEVFTRMLAGSSLGRVLVKIDS
ncbi:MAG: YhdH/YhfP family quinone oxidoreductase [Xanthomonadaceae bacterium]|nr:YhdH/YhfP family quinone oxidoreductase [Xanthomonadaceae bacterium]